MKLVRTVHTSVQVFYAGADELLPDIQTTQTDGGDVDRCLLFVSDNDVHAFLFTAEQARELVDKMSERPASKLEVLRTLPSELLT